MAFLAAANLYVKAHYQELRTRGQLKTYPHDLTLRTSGRIARGLMSGGIVTLYILSILGLASIGPWSGSFSTCVGILVGVGVPDLLLAFNLADSLSFRAKVYWKFVRIETERDPNALPNVTYTDRVILRLPLYE